MASDAPRAARGCGLLAAFVLASMLVGCGYPAAAPQNMELITSLRTACSARNPTWLDTNEKKINEQRAAGQMSDEEYEAFKSIIDRARGGDWKGAEEACLAFQHDQGPTPEQIEKIRAFHEKGE